MLSAWFRRRRSLIAQLIELQNRHDAVLDANRRQPWFPAITENVGLKQQIIELNRQLDEQTTANNELQDRFVVLSSRNHHELVDLVNQVFNSRAAALGLTERL